jgi:hypothetical protein
MWKHFALKNSDYESWHVNGFFLIHKFLQSICIVLKVLNSGTSTGSTAIRIISSMGRIVSAFQITNCKT